MNMMNAQPQRPYQRATKEELAARNPAILDMLKEGSTPASIARGLGINSDQVRKIIRANGRMHEQFLANKRSKVILPKQGTLGEAVGNQSLDFKRWLTANTPADSSLSEFLISIAVDAFQDELETATTTTE